MIEIPQNEVQMDDYEKFVREVLSQLTTGKDKHGEGCIGTAYIDWGVTGGPRGQVPWPTHKSKPLR